MKTMKIAIISLILIIQPLALFARGHRTGGSRASSGSVDYHFRGATHYTYHPFNPRSF